MASPFWLKTILLHLCVILLFGQQVLEAQKSNNLEQQKEKSQKNDIRDSYSICKKFKIADDMIMEYDIIITEYESSFIHFNISNKETNAQYFTVIDSSIYKEKYNIGDAQKFIELIKAALEDDNIASASLEISSNPNDPTISLKIHIEQKYLILLFGTDEIEIKLALSTPTLSTAVKLIYSLSSQIYKLQNKINEIMEQENAKNHDIEARIKRYTSLKGWFIGESFDINSKKWNDISNNANHVKTITGSVKTAKLQNENVYIYGGTADSICFPKNLYLRKEAYTLITIAKYNGNARGRIFQSMNSNWLSGFYHGKSGVAYHEEWLTQDSVTVHGDNWVLSVGQPKLYRSNGITRTTQFTNYGKNEVQMCINTGKYEEPSDWAVATVMIFDSLLNMKQILEIESYLMNRYDQAILSPF